MFERQEISNVVRDGTSQDKRMIPTLNREYVKIDERNRKELIDFTSRLASSIPYYDLNNNVNGNWQSFFEDQDPCNPHYALFLSFLHCFRFAQTDLNSLLEKHLTFYYKDVLGLGEKKAIPDLVPVIFELAKNFDKNIIPAGTALKAGKDDLGKELFYKTLKDLVVNKSQIAEVRSVFMDEIFPEIEDIVKKNSPGNEEKEIEPEPYHMLWAAPVANSKDGSGEDLDDPSKGWKPFGERQINLPAAARTMQNATIGFAISSPVLLLKEGLRTVRCVFRFSDSFQFREEDLEGKLQVYFTGEEGWIGPFALSTDISVPGQIGFSVEIPESEGAILPYREDIFLEKYHIRTPVMKFILKGTPSRMLSKFSKITSTKIDLSVNVENVRDLVLQNDQTVLDPGKPFQPFGPSPIIGSSFYIGSNEIFRKQVTALDLEMEWMDLPSRFQDHYTNYLADSTVLTNDSFKAEAAVLYDKQWHTKTGAPLLSLFEKEQSGTKGDKSEITEKSVKTLKTKVEHEKSMKILKKGVEGEGTGEEFPGIKILIDREKGVIDYKYDPNYNYKDLAKYDHTSVNGFVKLELREPVISTGSITDFSAFGHTEYPKIYAQKIMLGEDGNLPNAPYTPTLKSVCLHYEATDSLEFSSHAGQNSFFHIEPFGLRKIRETGQVSILPAYDREGYFYLGIRDLDPPQNLAILFQTVDGTAEPVKTDLRWSYLSDNRWIPLQSRVLSDTTLSLQISGIVEFQIPDDATLDHTLMPSNLHWIRGEADSVEGISRIIDIHTQAVLCSFDDQNNHSDHLKTALESGRISKMAVKDPAIKTVSQPYASYGGKVSEEDEMFFTRVGERLRHKSRAITSWDYERLVLDRFPSIYKVKCLNHTDYTSEFAPGHVTLVVVPNVKNRKAVDFFAPKVSLKTLSEIKKYLQQFISPSVELEVINPNYQEVRVEFNVAFSEGMDEGFYTQKLSEDIRRFLTPWTFDDGKDIVFGGKIYKSAILEFIENQHYVDFVTDFKFFHENEGIGEMMITLKGFVTKEAEFEVKSDIEIAEPANSRSVLISAVDHKIHVIRSADEECTKEDGINDMAVELELEVSLDNF